jgi:hypothetical protein
VEDREHGDGGERDGSGLVARARGTCRCKEVTEGLEITFADGFGKIRLLEEEITRVSDDRGLSAGRRCRCREFRGVL